MAQRYHNRAAIDPAPEAVSRGQKRLMSAQGGERLPRATSACTQGRERASGANVVDVGQARLTPA
jgi:hypothetical protein